MEALQGTRHGLVIKMPLPDTSRHTHKNTKRKARTHTGPLTQNIRTHVQRFKELYLSAHKYIHVYTKGK